MSDKLHVGLRWYLQRLRVMSVPEIFYRFGQMYRLRVLRRRREPCDSHGFVKLAQDAAGFGFCRGAGPQLPELSWRFDPARAEATGLLEGRRKVFSRDWQWRPGDSSVWHAAPDTGRQWPRKFFAEISYRPGNPYGDVRVTWEPSRLQHLVDLGLLARCSDKAATRTAAVAQIEEQLMSWVKANPAYVGIHYISAMECGLRILALCHALDLVRDRLAPDTKAWRALIHVIHTHAFLLERRLSLFSSSGNHTIAECCALVYAGVLFPEFDGARRWKEKGMGILEREARRQILSDGGGIERAFWYHYFVTDLLGLVLRLLTHRGEPVPAAMREAHGRARDFLRVLAATPDAMPRMGDCDDGHALSSHLRISWDDGMQQRPELVTCVESGCSIVNSVQPRAALILDHGPLGMPPNYGHGHADALSVCFALGDQAVFDDPGTYTYNTDLEWRKYFRGTRAHNTVVVDGLDQARQQGAFMWSEPYRSRLAGSRADGRGKILLLACHDGYRRRAGVTHWRGLILYNFPKRWVVWDFLAGEGDHHLELNWHVAVPVERITSGFSLGARDFPVSMQLDGGETSVCTAHIAPVCGWRSGVYGEKEPCFTISSHFHGRLPHEFVTHLSLGSAEPGFSIADDISQLRAWVT
ncbi:MAG: alginate lyase family protein [Pseudomonadota bacterium]